MKRGILFSALSLVAVLGLVTMANAGPVTWNYLTHSSLVGCAPGDDQLMGTTDDVCGGTDDTANTWGSYCIGTTDFGSACTLYPVKPGPDNTTYMQGTTDWCMGSPTSGVFEITELDVVGNSALISGTKLSIESKINRCDPPGTSPTNDGSPCPGSVSVPVDFETETDVKVTLLGVPLFSSCGAPLSGKMFDADSVVPGDPTDVIITCEHIDSTETDSYTQADVETMRGRLPAAALYFTVGCSKTIFPPNDDPCYDGPTGAGSANVLITWTDDDVTACDGEGCPTGGCLAATAEAVE